MFGCSGQFGKIARFRLTNAEYGVYYLHKGRLMRTLAKPSLSLDWVERTNDVDAQRLHHLWVCVSDGCDLTVCQVGNKVSAYACDRQRDGFSSVYEAMRWAETIWLTESM